MLLSLRRWLGAVVLVGCVDLKTGVPDAPSAPVDARGGDAAASDSPAGGDASDASDAGALDPYEELRRKLAAKRTRIGDVPERVLVSDSRVYFVERVGTVHSYRPSDGTRVDYTFSRRLRDHVIVTDDYVGINADAFDVYAAGQANVKVASTSLEVGDDVVAAASNHFAFIGGGPGRADVRLFDLSTGGAPANAGFIPSYGLVPMGRSGSSLVFRSTVDAKVWIFDTDSGKSRSLAVKHLPSAAGLVRDGVVIEWVDGRVGHTFVASDGSARELDVEIEAATSPVPGTDRKGMGSFTQFGDWLIFSARAGLLAFHVFDKRLEVCQLSEPQTLMREPQVVGGVLVFSIFGGDRPGVYSVKLAEVLPSELRSSP